MIFVGGGGEAGSNSIYTAITLKATVCRASTSFSFSFFNLIHSQVECNIVPLTVSGCDSSEPPAVSLGRRRLLAGTIIPGDGGDRFELGANGTFRTIRKLKCRAGRHCRLLSREQQVVLTRNRLNADRNRHKFSSSLGRHQPAAMAKKTGQRPDDRKYLSPEIIYISYK